MVEGAGAERGKKGWFERWMTVLGTWGALFSHPQSW